MLSLKIDIKMPTTCYLCPFCYDGIGCVVLDERFDREEGDDTLEHQRLENCPLVEVTE